MREEKENQELKKLFKSVKEVLINKGLLNQEGLPQKRALSEEKRNSHVSKEPKEKRRCTRLSLTRDFNKTIIARINFPNKSENIKSFVNNISLEGISLETKKEMKENDKIKLRLFFYGNQIPMIKVQARIIWKKNVEITNRYGASFDLIEEKDKGALNRYIEANIRKEQGNGTESCF